MSLPVLYFHGFASSPQSQKLVALKKLLAPDIELISPDMNVPSFERLDWEAMVRRGLDEARRLPPKAIVGSSLGALIALELVRRGIVAPLVLIAPAVGIGERWSTKLPPGDPIRVYNHARDGEADIHRAFFEQMSRVEPEKDPPAAPVTVIMGRLDESVPFSLVEEVWKRWQESGRLQQGSLFREIPDGDHGLVAHVSEIAAQIRARAR